MDLFAISCIKQLFDFTKYESFPFVVLNHINKHDQNELSKFNIFHQNFHILEEINILGLDILTRLLMMAKTLSLFLGQNMKVKIKAASF